MRENIRSIVLGDARHLPINFFIATKTDCSGAFRVKRERSDIVAFEYILKGSGWLRTNGHVYEPRAGDLFILHKNSNHVYESSRNEPWQKMSFCTSGLLVEALIAVYKLENVHYLSRCRGVIALFRKLYRVLQETNTPLDERAGAVAALMLSIVHRVASQAASLSKRYTDDVRKIMDYIDMHADAALSISDLSSVVGKSECSIINKFKKEVGTTPYQYLLNKRLATAESLLQTSDLKIGEIAAMLHFKSGYYFSTQFRMKYGCTPGYLRNHMSKRVFKKMTR